MTLVVNYLPYVGDVEYFSHFKQLVCRKQHQALPLMSREHNAVLLGGSMSSFEKRIPGHIARGSTTSSL